MSSENDTRDSYDRRIDEIVYTYQSSLLNMCALLLRDRSLAEDAVQETFIKAYRALPKLQRQERTKSWLMRIAVNTCRDMQRTSWFKHRYRHVTADALNERAAVGDEFSAQELAMAIAQLPAKEKEVILLYYYQDMTMEEIARTLCIAVSTVSRLHKHGLKALHSLFGEENNHE